MEDLTVALGHNGKTLRGEEVSKERNEREVKDERGGEGEEGIHRNAGSGVELCRMVRKKTWTGLLNFLPLCRYEAKRSPIQLASSRASQVSSLSCQS